MPFTIISYSQMTVHFGCIFIVIFYLGIFEQNSSVQKVFQLCICFPKVIMHYLMKAATNVYHVYKNISPWIWQFCSENLSSSQMQVLTVLRRPSFLCYPKTGKDTKVIFMTTLWSMWNLSEARRSIMDRDYRRLCHGEPWLWPSITSFTWFWYGYYTSWKASSWWQ